MIDKILFWLYLHTPERLKSLYPQRIIDSIGETATKKISALQADITRLKWQQKEADKRLKEVKANDPDNNS